MDDSLTLLSSEIGRKDPHKSHRKIKTTEQYLRLVALLKKKRDEAKIGKRIRVEKRKKKRRKEVADHD